MRAKFFAFALSASLVAGCAQVALQDSTIAVGNTLTDLHYRMVLDNLAMFRANPDSLPWHLKVTQGAVQINDAIQPTFTISGPPVSRNLQIQGSQSWQESWTVVPEIDQAKLRALRRTYQNAAKRESFDKHFEEGDSPRGKPFGKYGLKYVWVKEGQLAALTELTLDVLEAGAVAEGERALQLPGLRNR